MPASPRSTRTWLRPAFAAVSRPVNRSHSSRRPTSPEPAPDTGAPPDLVGGRPQVPARPAEGRTRSTTLPSNTREPWGRQGSRCDHRRLADATYALITAAPAGGGPRHRLD